MINKIGLRGIPCGTPWFGVKKSLLMSLILMDIDLSLKKLLIYLNRFWSIPNFFILWRRPVCQTWSNAFSTSRKTADVTTLCWCFALTTELVWINCRSYFFYFWNLFVVYYFFSLHQSLILFVIIFSSICCYVFFIESRLIKIVYKKLINID